MEKLLIATANPGKLREIEAILRAALPSGAGAALAPHVDLILPAQLGLDLNVEEDGETYQENAARKAQAYCRASGLAALADDTGLEVDALGGAPGIYSARYAQRPNATDADRRQLLLQNLGGHARPWTARFHCAVVIAVPAGEIFAVEGICPGEIIPTERGTGGFGYDPIFYLPEMSKTMAELPEEVKNRVSHRARAVNAAMPVLWRLFGRGVSG